MGGGTIEASNSISAINMVSVEEQKQKMTGLLSINSQPPINKITPRLANEIPNSNIPLNANIRSEQNPLINKHEENCAEEEAGNMSNILDNNVQEEMGNSMAVISDSNAEHSIIEMDEKQLADLKKNTDLEKIKNIRKINRSKSPNEGNEEIKDRKISDHGNIENLPKITPSFSRRIFFR